jgi:hypothetical protein
MKILIFINGKEEESQKVLVRQIASGCPLNFVSQELRDELPENLYSLIQNIEVKTIGPKSIASINRHSITKFPTLIFNHDDTDVYKWEERLPSIEELVKTIKNYSQILQMSIPEVDWSIDD